MNPMRRFMTYAVLSFLPLGVGSCERVALMPRPDVDGSGTYRQQGDSARDTDRTRRASTEVVGIVERVDSSRKEIELRENDRRNSLVVLRYDPRTVAYDRDRALEVEDLRAGDQIAVKMAPRGERYADVIRMLDRRSSVY
jgi:hypothetical protein